mmetsp:Transcript_106676/g.299726  ORF Transcript_106676/g.299726 Transcript_106676/m.299726 type:complete len:244 (+) Transcript_106676:70-801(+)
MCVDAGACEWRGSRCGTGRAANDAENDLQATLGDGFLVAHLASYQSPFEHDAKKPPLRWKRNYTRFFENESARERSSLLPLIVQREQDTTTVEMSDRANYGLSSESQIDDEVHTTPSQRLFKQLPGSGRLANSACKEVVSPRFSDVRRRAVLAGCVETLRAEKRSRSEAGTITMPQLERWLFASQPMKEVRRLMAVCKSDPAMFGVAVPAEVSLPAIGAHQHTPIMGGAGGGHHCESEPHHLE